MDGGEAPSIRVAVQEADFDLGAEAERMGGDDRAGALVTFTGLVRGDGGLSAMEIEHYPGMTERAIRAMADEAARRWGLTGVLVIHRFGRLGPGARIMMVATAAPHRADAFAAAEYLMDYLKSRAPFWKKEMTARGASWVAARGEDEAALKRW